MQFFVIPCFVFPCIFYDVSLLSLFLCLFHWSPVQRLVGPIRNRHSGCFAKVLKSMLIHETNYYWYFSESVEEWRWHFYGDNDRKILDQLRIGYERSVKYFRSQSSHALNKVKRVGWFCFLKDSANFTKFWTQVL